MKYINLSLRRAFALISSCFLLNNANAAITTGTYTVGSGGAYANLAAALTDLNSSTLTGPVVFNILPGTYIGSDWQMQINGITGSSAANTVTFQPSAGAGTVLIQADGSSSANYIFELNNVNYVTIRNLALTNTSSADYGTVIHITGSSSYDSVYNCTLTAPTATSSSSDMAVVNIGYGSSTVTGENLYIANNDVIDGDMGITLAGASALSSNDIIDNNIISGSLTYGMYIGGAGNFKARNNTITTSSTAYNTGMYLDGLANGLDISGNAITINSTASGNVYGIYNANINASSSSATSSINNNTVSVTVTDGKAYSLYNNSCHDLSITNNSFGAYATDNGIAFPPVVAYGGSNITATGNTFDAECNTGGIANSNNYRLVYSSNNSTSNNVEVHHNIFNFTTAGGDIGSTSNYGSAFLYNVNGTHVSHNVFNVSMNDYGNMYGFAGWFLFYNSASSSFDSNRIEINAPYGVGELYGYGYEGAIGSSADVSVSGDTMNINTTYGEIYPIGYVIAEYGTHPIFNNNIVNTLADDYGADIYLWYMDNGNQDGEFKNNQLDVTSPSGYSIYWPFYMAEYASNSHIEGNKFDVQSSGSAYAYFPYACAEGSYSDPNYIKNNTFNYNCSDWGTIICPYELSAYGNGNDTLDGNSWNVSTNSSIYAYNEYFNSVATNNSWTLNSNYGSVYTYLYYPDECVFAHNTINSSSAYGTVCGLYLLGYYSSSSAKPKIIGNTVNVSSTGGGSVYGYYDNGPGSAIVMNNVFSTNTSGNSYLVRARYGADGEMLFLNNTFHSNSTGSTNTLLYSGNSGYSGKYYFYNNIFSRSNSASDNAIDVADTNYFFSDYNLYYSPGTPTLSATSPSVSATSLQAWRSGANRDMNSLIYEPGFVDAANGDFHPDAANPNSWAMQGRGRHIDGDTLDFNNNARAKTRFDGVPDLGAYEFTPTVNPPDAVATPASPASASTQVFTFGQDTVCSIAWGATVPSTVSVQQYTGLQANPMPYSGVGRMFFYTKVNTSLNTYEYKPLINYKDTWLGDISSETNARIAKSNNGGPWEGFNFQNGITDTNMNTLTPLMTFDSLSAAFTGVENARIGKRCVAVPTGLNNYLIAADSAMEAWDPAFSPIGYEVIADQSPLTPVPPYNNLAFTTDPNLKLKPLHEDTKYYVHVRTICGVGDTSAWAIDSFTTLITCHAPQLQITSLKSDAAVIYWDTIKTAYAWDYVLDQNPADPTTGTNTNVRSKYAFPLQSGTTYYMHVRSKCSSVYPISETWSTLMFITPFPAGVDKVSNADIMSVYPNPVKDLLTISLKGKRDGTATVSISDITGKEVRNAEMKEDKLEINMTGLSSGIYIVTYKDNSQTQITKINKQ